MANSLTLRPDEEEQIWALYVQQVPCGIIAKQVKVNKNTVTNVIQRVKRELAERRGAEFEEAREEALAVYAAVMREAWESKAKCGPSSNAAVGYLSAIIQAQQASDRLLGLDEITINHRGVYLARIESVMSRPVLVAGFDENHDVA